jgi:hypothetical protein
MITDEDFTEVAELLEECLEELGVETPDIKTIIAIVAGYKEQTVSK